MVQTFNKTLTIAKIEDYLRIRKIKTQVLHAANSYPDERSFYISYASLEKEDRHLAEILLMAPSYFLDCAQKALMNILPPDSKYPFTIRITDVPSRRYITNFPIRTLTSKLVGSLICVDGLVRRVTDTRPLMTRGAFVCERCGTITTVDQDDIYLKEPLECSKDAGGCGSAGGRTRFKLLTARTVIKEKLHSRISEFEDTQIIEIQEPHEDLRGGQEPRRLQAILSDDLINTIAPGNRITLTGILKSRRRGGYTSRSNYFIFYLDINSIKIIDTEYEEVIITPQDEEEIIALSESPNLKERMIASIAPAIYGMHIEKEAILMQLFGGVPKVDATTRIRGDIHILLVGDPGIAKSQLLAYVAKISPRGIYASGKASTAAGLTAAAIRAPADLSGESRWTLEAGALVLADKGIACIDELDKMKEEDRDSIHTAMEQQQISINKAGISATMQSRCAVLAAANPKLGRWDPHKLLPEQIELDPPLLSRFDAIFTMTDKVDEEADRKIATHIVNTHFIGEALQSGNKKYEAQIAEIRAQRNNPISPELFKKYIAYSKKTIYPVMSSDIQTSLIEYYVSIRRRSEGGPIQMTPRNQEALIRLTEASARMHLRKTPIEDDFKTAVKIVKAFLESSALSEEGVIDTDIITTGFGTSQRDRIWSILEIIKDIQGTDGASRDDIMRIAEERGLPPNKINDDLERLKREGRIYEKFEGKFRMG